MCVKKQEIHMVRFLVSGMVMAPENGWMHMGHSALIDTSLSLYNYSFSLWFDVGFDCVCVCFSMYMCVKKQEIHMSRFLVSGMEWHVWSGTWKWMNAYRASALKCNRILTKHIYVNPLSTASTTSVSDLAFNQYLKHMQNKTAASLIFRLSNSFVRNRYYFYIYTWRFRERKIWLMPSVVN